LLRHQAALYVVRVDRRWLRTGCAVMIPLAAESNVNANDQFTQAIARFDEANAQDPKGEALVYSQRMSAWVGRLAPDSSDELKLAARAQHICRWMIPRDTYPMTRAGYHQWRDRLAQ